MYSSVPTNEFDGVEGSETTEGGMNSLDLLRFNDVECFITCRTYNHHQCDGLAFIGKKFLMKYKDILLRAAKNSLKN